MTTHFAFISPLLDLPLQSQSHCNNEQQQLSTCDVQHIFSISVIQILLLTIPVIDLCCPTEKVAFVFISEIENKIFIHSIIFSQLQNSIFFFFNKLLHIIINVVLVGHGVCINISIYICK